MLRICQQLATLLQQYNTSSAVIFYCRLKTYFLGQKINLSGVSPGKRSRSGPNSVYVDMSRGDNVRVILGKMGAGTSPAERELFCGKPRDFSAFRNGRFLPNLVTKRISASHHGIRKDIFENFHFTGHFPPKSEIENQSNRHIPRSRLQVTGCTAERYCLSTLQSKDQGVSEIW